MTDARVQPNELTLELCSSRLLARTRMRPPDQMRPGAQGGLPRPRHGRRRHAAVATTRRVLYFPRMVVSDISVKLVVLGKKALYKTFLTHGFRSHDYRAGRADLENYTAHDNGKHIIGKRST